MVMSNISAACDVLGAAQYKAEIPESVNDNLALDTLNWVHYHSYSSGVQLLKALYTI